MIAFGIYLLRRLGRMENNQRFRPRFIRINFVRIDLRLNCAAQHMHVDNIYLDKTVCTVPHSYLD